jgi:hypothetical protein
LISSSADELLRSDANQRLGYLSTIALKSRLHIDPAPTMTEVENHFTVFVRLPFNRGNFVDPPPVRLCPLCKHLQRLITSQVAWSNAKETKLWDVISRQKGNDIDCMTYAES